MTAAEAGEWLRDRAQAFRVLDRRILDTQHRAAVYTGKQVRGSAKQAAGRKLVESLGALLRGHQTTLNRWDALVDRLPFLAPDDTLGILPLIPLALAGTVVAVATSMALIFRRITAEERAVRLLEQGTITPAEAIELTRQIEGGGRALLGGIPLGMIAALGVGAYFLFVRGVR